MRLIPDKPPKEIGEGAVMTGSVVSGGIVGVAMASLARALPPPWDSTALTITPTITAAWAVLIAAAARWLKRRYHSRSWHADRDRFITWVNNAIPAAQKGFDDTQALEAREVFAERIARLEKLKAFALTAIPFERPWETDQVGDQDRQLSVPTIQPVRET
jgi:hypothetical protein